MRKLIILMPLLLFFLFPAEVNAENLFTIDSPSTATLLKGDVNFIFTIYNDGGILFESFLGITDGFMLGIPLDFENLIGGRQIRIKYPPVVSAKLRLFREKDSVPSILIGYDPIGFGNWNPDAPSSYGRPAKGAYLVLGKTLRLLSMNAGLNVGLSGGLVDTISSNRIKYFSGISLNILPELSVAAEIDNLDLNEINDDSVLYNASVTYFLSEDLQAVLSFRNLKSRAYDRTVRIVYKRTFF